MSAPHVPHASPDQRDLDSATTDALTAPAALHTPTTDPQPHNADRDPADANPSRAAVWGERVRLAWQGAGVALLVWVTLNAITVLGGQAFFGLSPYVITGDSMEPAINRGDVILVSDPPPATEPVGEGTVITFAQDPTGAASVDADDSVALVTITHRVVDVDIVDGEPVYATAGDATDVTDPMPVNHDQLDGVAEVRLPFIGVPWTLL